ncbi:glycosyltransferase [Gaetbulibacter sp. M235]|uniref:glycosyltransferase n=1 Tax=Gaetbulibacter sp. M235 TaxID=3126510 RepID=UPI00374FC9C3
MRKILHIVGTMDRAGAETMVMNLYRAIDKTKYQFDFVYFTERTCSYDEEIIALGGTIYRIPEKYNKSPLLRTFKLFKLIKANKPFYAIHCHQLLGNSFHLTAAYFSRVNKRIAHAHSTRDFNDNSLIRCLYQNFSRKIISLFATDFIACGKAPGKFLFPNQKNITFIPNAIDVPKFLESKNKRKESFFNNININDKTIVLSQIGRFMPVKNHEFSVNFASFLKDNGIDFHLNFVGSGYLESEIKEIVTKKGLSNYISFLGVKENINMILANTDVLLMPSIYEGFPVILVESQAAGVPALISKGISKEVDLGLNLIYFCDLEASYNTWHELVNTIIQKPLISANKRHKVLREKGYDIEVSVKLLEKVYSK